MTSWHGRVVARRRGLTGHAPRRRGWWPTAGSACTAAVMTGLLLLGVQEPALAWFAVPAAWLAFAAGAWLVLRVPPRRATPLILLGAVALQLAALSAPPRTSTDLYRYIWDGRVQAAGVDPYRYVPAAPQLTNLRDRFLWPPGGPICITSRGVTSGPGAGAELAQASVAAAAALTPGCTRINRPGVHTIYPPVAEAYFTAVDELTPAGSGSLPIQAAAAICSIATAVLLLAGLRRLGRDPRLAVLWAWCPLIGIEAGNNAHVDVLAAALTAAALLTLARAGGRRRTAVGAVLLGLAVATKITPILVVPAVLRRRPATLVIAGAATGLVYVPHLIAVGGGVIGFLPGYVQEQGYSNGHGFELLSIILPGRWATLAALIVLAALAAVVVCRTDPDRPWRGALVLTGAALAVTTPPFAWYATLLVVLVAVDGRAEWLALAAAAPLGAAGYATALAIVVGASVLRRLRQPGEDGPAVGVPRAGGSGRAASGAAALPAPQLPVSAAGMDQGA